VARVAAHTACAWLEGVRLDRKVGRGVLYRRIDLGIGRNAACSCLSSIVARNANAITERDRVPATDEQACDEHGALHRWLDGASSSERTR
jgi:hypothetical protein